MYEQDQEQLQSVQTISINLQGTWVVITRALLQLFTDYNVHLLINIHEQSMFKISYTKFFFIFY